MNFVHKQYRKQGMDSIAGPGISLYGTVKAVCEDAASFIQSYAFET